MPRWCNTKRLGIFSFYFVLCSLSYQLCSLSVYYFKLVAGRFTLTKPLNNPIMKRFILLLLILICFRFSYGEELSAEQKQLAWKFIQGHLQSGDYLPNTFISDIVINLKGEVT